MMKLVLATLCLLIASSAYAQTPTPTPIAAGVLHLYTIDNVEIASGQITTWYDAGSPGGLPLAPPTPSEACATGGERPDLGNAAVCDGAGDYYDAPTPGPTVAAPYTVYMVFQPTCSGVTCDPQLWFGTSGIPAVQVYQGDRYRSSAGQTVDMLFSTYSLDLNAWTLLEVTVNGASSRVRAFQPGVGWVSVSGNLNTGGFDGTDTFRLGASQTGASDTMQLAAAAIQSVADANDPDITTASQWLIDNYMITPTPTNTPTPTMTFTATPTNVTCIEVQPSTANDITAECPAGGWSGPTELLDDDGGEGFEGISNNSNSGCPIELKNFAAGIASGFGEDITDPNNFVTIGFRLDARCGSDCGDYSMRWLNGSGSAVGPDYATYTSTEAVLTEYRWGETDRAGQCWCSETGGGACSANASCINLQDADVGFKMEWQDFGAVGTESTIRADAAYGLFCAVIPVDTPTDTPTHTPTPTPTCHSQIVSANSAEMVWCGPEAEYVKPQIKKTATNWTPRPTVHRGSWTPMPTPAGTPGAQCWKIPFSAGSGDQLFIDVCGTPPVFTATATPTNTPEPTSTFTPVDTPTNTATPTETNTPTATPTFTVTPTTYTEEWVTTWRMQQNCVTTGELASGAFDEVCVSHLIAGSDALGGVADYEASCWVNDSATDPNAIAFLHVSAVELTQVCSVVKNNATTARTAELCCRMYRFFPSREYTPTLSPTITPTTTPTQTATPTNTP